MHICRIWKKNGIDDLTYKAETDTDVENTKEVPEDGVGWIGKLGLTYISYWYYV